MSPGRQPCCSAVQEVCGWRPPARGEGREGAGRLNLPVKAGEIQGFRSGRQLRWQGVPVTGGSEAMDGGRRGPQGPPPPGTAPPTEHEERPLPRHGRSAASMTTPSQHEACEPLVL